MRRVQKAVAFIVLAAALAVGSEPAAIWLDVPFVLQEKNGCGAAAISMVMRYWEGQQNRQMAAADDPAEIQRALYSSGARGIFASDLTGYLETHGYRVFAFRAGWDDLRQHLLKGRPLIVALGATPGNSALHYVVVAGLDSGRDLIVLNDPARRKLTKLDRKTFERQWSAMDQWTLLAVPH